MRHGLTHSLIYQFQHPIWQHLHKIFRQVSYLNYKSFSNLYGVADWLIISGLNAILPCTSSFIKYNIHVCHAVLCMMDLMNFHGQWNMKSLNIKKRNSLILSWHTLIYFMQKLELFRQCPWQNFFPHIILIRSEAPRGSVLPWSLQIMHLSPQIPERKYLSSLKIFFLCSPNP